MPQHLTCERSMLDHVMAWRRRAACDYLGQCDRDLLGYVTSLGHNELIRHIIEIRRHFYVPYRA